MKRACLRVKPVKSTAKLRDMEGERPNGPPDTATHKANNIPLIFCHIN